MGESRKSKREETREFWRAAIQLWNGSGLSVREFCRREGLAEPAFYAWRRELLAEKATPEADQESSATKDGEASPARRRRQEQVGADDTADTSIASPFVEWVAPAPSGLCHCTVELENTDGAKMRIQLCSTAMPDLAAISQSFWNRSS